MDDPRIDPFIDLKFGTILRNWEEMLLFLLNCRTSGINRRVNFVFAGHSHENIEFRIQTLQGRSLNKTPFVEIWPFKKLEIPCAVYFGNYSAEYAAEIKYLDSLEQGEKHRRLSNSHLITNKYPFLIETTSLGPRSTSEHDRSNIQGYRIISIKENRVESFSIRPIYRFFTSFDAYIGK